MTAVAAPTRENIRRAAALVREGRLVAFPTETVYGLGTDARQEAAVRRIFEAKGRPYVDPLIVHVENVDALQGVCGEIDERVRRLAAAFWPGPLTMVLPKSPSIPDVVTAGHVTVAVRVPAHPIALALLGEAACPIAAPSANPFGYLSPTRAEHVARQLGARVDFILDGGPCSVGLESTIVDLSGETPALLRSGAVELERIEALIGTVAHPSREAVPRAPGQLESHYAPRTRLALLSAPATAAVAGRRVGLLRFSGSPPEAGAFGAVEVLSRSGDLREAAANLFASLHRLDEAGLDVIYAEPVPEVGLGFAIADRLRRAAASR